MKQLYQTLQPTLNPWQQSYKENGMLWSLTFPKEDKNYRYNLAITFDFVPGIWLPNKNNYLIYSGISPGLLCFLPFNYGTKNKLIPSC